MSGKLFIVGTPIGNLDDMSKRAIDTLNSVDFIACEDTRVTIKLLNHFGIKKKLVSFHEFSPKEKEEKIIHELKSGKKIALVSDAGMPLISDPGYELVRRCIEEGIEVTVVPGPSAFVCALVLSGQNTYSFVFEGFLPKNKRAKREKLESLKYEKRTLIFYEAPHKLLDTLSQMAEIFGVDREISIVKEITKVHESVMLTNLSKAIEFFKQNPPKGEYVLVVRGYEDAKEKAQDDNVELIRERLKEKFLQGFSKKEAAKMVADELDLPKNKVYKIMIESNEFK
ncbi:Uroporphyrin-III C/tetrapyrrole (Corrin/Porphyrin) methyltransferase [Caldicellulosiruptor acetigenus I77R1B]|uniref:Ribosomal RNA small subunit methyltransferase I n=1 Tax=Caldicellulosiruptor acetigenus (strain ATCC 700853 / DSM 12137 / I77R1B) TaxID=632335 RepID=E4S6G4_CALA7|nr:16S rRNA (cytidine(1402)-2'-O)-methyltransferase [Caldicellulosiruptor acetigenus]ADQ39722.1 Uroporphyrin-III C/tetrapyrrole (Corrin/Porphyrin) methyltransferase [Caldicellulosiruptor acetigenus I77R1B]